MSISTLQHLLSLLLYSLCNNQSGLKTKSKRRNDERFGCWNQNALCKNDNSDDQNCKVSRLTVWRWEAPSHTLLECMRQGCSFYSTWWEEIFETDSAFERNDLPFERSENMPWFDTDESWEQLSKSCCFLWKKVFVFFFFLRSKDNTVKEWYWKQDWPSVVQSPSRSLVFYFMFVFLEIWFGDGVQGLTAILQWHHSLWKRMGEQDTFWELEEFCREGILSGNWQGNTDVWWRRYSLFFLSDLAADQDRWITKVAYHKNPSPTVSVL